MGYDTARRWRALTRATRIASPLLGRSSTEYSYIVASKPRAAELARYLAHEYPEDDVKAGLAALYGPIYLDTDTVSTGGVETLKMWGYYAMPGDPCEYLLPPGY